jgi:hypothetical protein
MGPRDLDSVRLLTFLGCEKVIIEQDTHQISLVSVLQAVNIALPEAALPPPVGAASPFPWAILTLWQFPKEVTETSEEQYTALLSSGGEEMMRSGISQIVPPPPASVQKSPFLFVNSRIVDRFSAFPVWREGLCTVVLRTRKIGTEEWVDIADYPIELHYMTPPPQSS